MLLHLCTKFRENIFIILKLWNGINVCIKFDKGHNSVKMEPRFLVHVQWLSLNLACRQKVLVVSIILLSKRDFFLDLCIYILEKLFKI